MNCFILFILLEQGQLLNKPYTYFIENFVPRLPGWAGKVLGGCILCTATHMGWIELLFMGEFSILVVFYNAVATAVLYRLIT